MKRLAFAILIITAVSIPAQAKYSGGNGTAANPYQIATKADLLALGANTGDYSKCFILTVNIDMGKQVFTTAIIAAGGGPAFTGIFDGNGHKIMNFTINGGSNDFPGLFGYISSGGSVKKLGLGNFTVSGASFVGGLVGLNYGNISNCYSTGTVSGDVCVGGLVGGNGGGSISDCYSTGTVSGDVCVGGLVGSNTENGDISDCYSTCAVSGTAGVGGLVGYSDSGSISNCYSTGAVSGYLEVGGLVGNNYSGTVVNCYSTGTISGSISNCYSTGTVSGDGCVGGLVGLNYGNINNCYSTGAVSGTSGVGGLVGENNYGSISDCHSTGSVSSSSDSWDVGGLVGRNYGGSIIQCYSMGAVSGTSSGVGGLVGWNDGSISNCYSTGSASGTSFVGGLVGLNYGNINNCYSTGSVSGTSNNVGGLVGGNGGGSISNCYSTGTVSGDVCVGGLVGSNTENGDISDCYSTCAVSGTAGVGGLVGYSDSGSISSCYFLINSGPDNGLGTPLTDEQMKHQANFVGWDFVGETANGPNDIWSICEGVSYPKLAFGGQVQVTKCTVTAGSKDNSDTISISGLMDATTGDISAASSIEVTIDSNDIVSPCVQSFPIDEKSFKKGKYNYARTENASKRLFKYDTKNGKFTFMIKNVDLPGLGCPLTIEIEIGDYTGAAEVDEAIVNGAKKPIPIKLMMGVKNALRVEKPYDKFQVTRGKKKPNTDQLSVRGGFAVEDTDVNMANRVSEGLVVTLGTQQFTIPANELKAGKNKFTCSKADVTEGGIASATFNFTTCSFTITIKNTEIEADAGAVDLGLEFTDFDESVQIVLP